MGDREIEVRHRTDEAAEVAVVGHRSQKLRELILRHRFFLVVATHAMLAGGSLILAFLVRFDFHYPLASKYQGMMEGSLPLFIGIALLATWLMGLLGGMWRYVSTADLTAILKAALVTTLAFATLAPTIHGPGYPRSIPLLAGAFVLLSFGGIRFMIRKLRELFRPARQSGRRKRLLIVGAGDAGCSIVRNVLRTGDSREVIGFVDDDVSKHGLTIHGRPVLGPAAEIGVLVPRFSIDEILIAIPSAAGRRIREIVETCQAAGVAPKTLPGVDDLVSGDVHVNQIREVRIEDLLRRPPVKLNNENIGGLIKGQRVLVTGGGGSIGSELCRQILRFEPRTLVIYERSEPALYEIEQALVPAFPGVQVVPIVGDITDGHHFETVCRKYHPHVVFHAAAYKHVPMMEKNVSQAVINNVIGTQRVAWAAHRVGVPVFIQISTDKVVNPTSVMGCTKRIAELYVQELGRFSHTRFVTVRFGNVLGSVGSVIPLFKKQITTGGPVTVTHPEMQRYFMSIPEACQLILEAATMGRGGEIFVLDMGEPVKIVELARTLIRLMGKKIGEDIDIVFTGIRPGEKLFEEILTDDEGVVPTHHPSIVIGRSVSVDLKRLERTIDDLARLAELRDDDAVRRMMRVIVPEYDPAGMSSPGRSAREEESRAPSWRPAMHSAAPGAGS